MLGAAQANARGTETPRALGFLNGFGIGAHLHALVFSGPCHNGAKITRQFGLQCRHTTLHHASRRAVYGDDIALAQFAATNAGNLGVIIYPHLSSARHARPPQPARHNSGVAGHAPARCQNRARRIHAVNIFGAGFHPHQNDIFATRRFHFGNIGRKTDLAARRPRRGRQSTAQNVNLRRRVKCRVQQLFKGCRVEAQQRFAIVNLSGGNHVDRNFYRRTRGALATARLQNKQFAFLHGKFDILHIAEMRLKAAKNIDQLVINLRHTLLQ